MKKPCQTARLRKHSRPISDSGFSASCRPLWIALKIRNILYRGTDVVNDFEVLKITEYRGQQGVHLDDTHNILCLKISEYDLL